MTDPEAHAELVARLGRIERDLARVLERLDAVDRSCSNMDEHISFVESVYTAVRHPLSFLSRRALPSTARTEFLRA